MYKSNNKAKEILNTKKTVNLVKDFQETPYWLWLECMRSYKYKGISHMKILIDDDVKYNNNNKWIIINGTIIMYV